MSTLHQLTTQEIINGLASKDFSSVELTQHYLNRIHKYDSKINSFITVTGEQALEQAKQADALRANGDTRQLLGVPMAHKDIFCTKGVLTSAGSKILSNFVSPYDATVVEKVSASGMISLGKLNMDEFAMGSDNTSSFYGAVHNPWDLNSVPGGSSGGSAAAVAAGFVPLSTGTDTGGSIRQPASFCGLTGIKPTYGRVSRFGMIAYASSFDQAGSFGRTALDCAHLLDSMTGHDAKDSTSIDKGVTNYAKLLQATDKSQDDKPFAGLKIGVAKEYFGEGLDAQVESATRKALAQFEELGATIVEVNLTDPNTTLATYYLLAPAEASSNLSRFDGVRFGHRCENPTNLDDLYKRSRSEGFGDEVQRRILMGTYALSAGYFDAYYIKAQKVRRIIKNDFQKAFAECDIIVSPTAPTTAYSATAQLDPATMYLVDVYTIGVNLAGLPALSLPVGFDDSGKPIGLQMIGNYWEEDKLLQNAHIYQQFNDAHSKRANIE